jgi:hypothetical protein
MGSTTLLGDRGRKASTVAISAGLAWSSNSAIARRSFARGQRDLGEGGLVALEHKQKNGYVWEMRQAKIRRFKQEGGVGAVWAHRNLHRSAAAEADLELEFGQPGGWERGKRRA